MAEILLSCENITKTYPDGHFLVTALKNISVEIKEKDFIAVIGPSGSGKTTLLNILGFLDQPSQGKIVFRGNQVSGNNPTFLENIRRIYYGYVFQQPNLLPELTIYENIEIPLLIQYPLPGLHDRRSSVLDLLEKIDLKERMNFYPRQLSGGEQQRVAVARAIIHQPKILVLDEPTGSLDYENRDKIVNLLQMVHSSGNTTILMVTHDKDVAKIAQNILQLKDGEIIKK